MADSSTSSLGSMFGGRTVMSGLMSGLDTEALVKSATANLKTSINTKKQKLQTLTWKQNAYRDIITKLSDFQSKYLDILSPTSIRANAVMNKYKSESTNDKLEVTAGANATPATYDITYSKKATAAKIEGGKATEGSIKLDFSKAESGDNTVEITLDGNTREVTFQGGNNVKQNFLDALNKEFKDVTSTRFAFKDDGSDDLTGTLTLKTLPNDKVSHNFEAHYSDALGLDNNAYSRITKNSMLKDIDFATALDGDSFKFSINGKDFSFNKDSKISDIINAVNKSDAGVTMSFSTLSQNFVIESSKTGAGQQVEITQERGNLINALFNVDNGSETGGISWGSSTSKAFTVNVFNPDKAMTTEKLDKAGYASNRSMFIEVDGENYKLDLSALTKKQETESANINGKNRELSIWNDEDKGKLYTYKDEDGTTHFLKGDKTEAFTVDSDGKTVKVNGNKVDSDSDYADLLDTTGFRNAKEVMHEFTPQEYEKAYNDALKNAFATNDKALEAAKNKVASLDDFNGTEGYSEDWYNELDSVDKELFDTMVQEEAEGSALMEITSKGLTFDLVAEKDSSGNIKKDDDGNIIYKEMAFNTGTTPVAITSNTDFGFTNKSNYDVHPMADTAVISDEKQLNFYNADGRKVTIDGTGTDGKITIKDLTDYRDANGNAIFKYDDTDGRITVAEGNSFTFADAASQSFLKDVFGKDTIKGVSDEDALTVYGSNAQVTINGVTLESSESSFTVDGTTMTFKNVEDFDAATDPDSKITVTTSKDNSAIVQTVKDFINDYNTLITDLYKAVNTSRPKDGKSYYDPLTEEQEDEMSDKEIEKWNEKAEQGWLYNDASVNRVINSIRSAMSTSFNGMSLYDLGITLKADKTGQDPKFEVDDSKLEAAISKWGDDVAKFFTDTDNGLANKLNNAIDAAVSTKSTNGAGSKKAYGYLTALAGVKDTVSEKNNQLFNQMETIQKIIDTMQERYESEQERYWKQFTTLETYISNMSMQMSAFQS